MNLRKYIMQSLLYLIEIGAIIVIFNYILSYFFPVESSFEYFTRSLGIYTVYQLFVYSTLKLAADAYQKVIIWEPFCVNLLYFAIEQVFKIIYVYFILCRYEYAVIAQF